MRRIVVIASSIAGARSAARLKRRLPEDEINLVVPSSLHEMAGQGPAARRMTLPNLEILSTRRVGIIEADDIMPDLVSNEVVVASARGRLPVRYSDLVVEMPVSARLPRALQKADNVIPMPLAGFTTAAKRCDALLAKCASDEKNAIVVGNGMEALAAVFLALEHGVKVQWLTVKDRPTPWVEPLIAEHLLTTLGPGLTRIARPDLALEHLSFVSDENNTLLAVTCPDGTTLKGGCYLWAAAIMVRHPLLREEGFALDGFGRIIKEEEAPAQIRLIGSGAGAPAARLARGKVSAPIYASAGEDLLAAYVTEEIAGASPDFPGLCGVHRCEMHSAATGSLTLCRAGLTMAEAETAGVEAEHATAVLACETDAEENAAAPSAVAGPIASPAAALSLTLICRKECGSVIGVQVMGRGGESAAADGLFGMAFAAMTQATPIADLALRETPGLPGRLLARAASMLRHKLAGPARGITPDELLASAEAGAEFFILDLRSQADWKERHLPEAYNIPFPQLKKRLQEEVPRHTPLVLVSADAADAFNAACMLAALGATDLYVLDGGMDLCPYPVRSGQAQ